MFLEDSCIILSFSAATCDKHCSSKDSRAKVHQNKDNRYQFNVCRGHSKDIPWRIHVLSLQKYPYGGLMITFFQQSLCAVKSCFNVSILNLYDIDVFLLVCLHVTESLIQENRVCVCVCVTIIVVHMLITQLCTC